MKVSVVKYTVLFWDVQGDDFCRWNTEILSSQHGMLPSRSAYSVGVSLLSRISSPSTCSVASQVTVIASLTLW